ncbi:hypothetical protein [Clostridium felsineum]|uniref:hypothetical protein n=1 Tax=Clostridium felsineum TaxID=36839 RepID=UPI00098CE824|nr:hypothetical protein [Clostridium felsineum]URZ15317.1 hypothetical protein CLFE_013350 [Clostridium felsineum DSM 794]
MIMSRKQAYEDYLNQYGTKIDNSIRKANEKQESRIVIETKIPQEIMDKLKACGYKLELTLGNSLNPNFLIVSWDE